jgi:hypothetical protein
VETQELVADGVGGLLRAERGGDRPEAFDESESFQGIEDLRDVTRLQLYPLADLVVSVRTLGDRPKYGAVVGRIRDGLA